MKKILPILLGLIGLGLVGFSVTRGWSGFTQTFGLGLSIDKLGYEQWQGIAAIVCALIGFALLFVKPKIGAALGALASIFALIAYVSPPVVEGSNFEPHKAVFIALAGGLLIALAGFIAPKRA